MEEFSRTITPILGPLAVQGVKGMSFQKLVKIDQDKKTFKQDVHRPLFLTVHILPLDVGTDWRWGP